jgi:hypothetical protein
MSNAASSNSTQNVSVNVSSVKQNANARHSNVCQRSNARRSVHVRSTRCVIRVERPEIAGFCGENIVFYKPSGRRTRGIAKILSHTVGTLSAFSNVAYVAHHFVLTVQNFVIEYFHCLGSVLKIRVSVVRFRPRPPDPHRQCESADGVLLCSASVIHADPTLLLLATRCGAC